MIQLKCQLCENWRILDQIDLAVALYQFHCIRDHWELMEKAHENPEMLEKALAMAMRI